MDRNKQGTATKPCPKRKRTNSKTKPKTEIYRHFDPTNKLKSSNVHEEFPDIIVNAENQEKCGKCVNKAPERRPRARRKSSNSTVPSDASLNKQVRNSLKKRSCKSCEKAPITKPPSKSSIEERNSVTRNSKQKLRSSSHSMSSSSSQLTRTNGSVLNQVENRIKSNLDNIRKRGSVRLSINDMRCKLQPNIDNRKPYCTPISYTEKNLPTHKEHDHAVENRDKESFRRSCSIVKQSYVQQLKKEISKSQPCHEELKKNVNELRSEIAKYRETLHKNVNFLQGKLGPNFFNNPNLNNSLAKCEKLRDIPVQTEPIEPAMLQKHISLTEDVGVSCCMRGIQIEPEEPVCAIEYIEEETSRIPPTTVDRAVENPNTSLESVENEGKETDPFQQQKENFHKVDQLIEEAEYSLNELKKGFYKCSSICQETQGGETTGESSDSCECVEILPPKQVPHMYSVVKSSDKPEVLLETFQGSECLCSSEEHLMKSDNETKPILLEGEEDEENVCEDDEDSHLNTISERTEEIDKSTSELSSHKEPTKKLIVQQMPQINIRPSLTTQKVFEIEIKPTGSVNTSIPTVHNILYEEIQYDENKDRPFPKKEIATTQQKVSTDTELLKSNRQDFEDADELLDKYRSCEDIKNGEQIDMNQLKEPGLIIKEDLSESKLPKVDNGQPKEPDLISEESVSDAQINDEAYNNIEKSNIIDTDQSTLETETSNKDIDTLNETTEEEPLQKQEETETSAKDIDTLNEPTEEEPLQKQEETETSTKDIDTLNETTEEEPLQKQENIIYTTKENKVHDLKELCKCSKEKKYPPLVQYVNDSYQEKSESEQHFAPQDDLNDDIESQRMAENPEENGDTLSFLKISDVPQDKETTDLLATAINELDAQNELFAFGDSKSEISTPEAHDSNESIYVLTHDVSVQVSVATLNEQCNKKEVSTVISADVADKSKPRPSHVRISDLKDSIRKKFSGQADAINLSQIRNVEEEELDIGNNVKTQTIMTVGVQYSNKRMQKSLNQLLVSNVKLHKNNCCKDIETTTSFDSESSYKQNGCFKSIPFRNIPYGDNVSSQNYLKIHPNGRYEDEADEFCKSISQSSSLSENRRIKKLLKSQRQNISITSSDSTSYKLDDTLSEGEIKCKCSVSIGELHLCRYAQEIKKQAQYLKKHPQNLLKFGENNVNVLKQKAYYNKWVAHYASTSTSPMDSDSNDQPSDI